VAVVNDGKVIHAKGYGVLGDSRPVDADRQPQRRFQASLPLSKYARTFSD
jgi:hypothetical protein